MGVFKVWVPSREHMSVQALYDAANVLYWKISERQNSTHLAFLKHQNTKTSLYKLSKNHWVIALLEISWSVRRELQFTVYLDHPVVHKEFWTIFSALIPHIISAFCRLSCLFSPSIYLIMSFINQTSP